MKVTVWGEGFLDLGGLPADQWPLKYADYIDEARRLYPDDVHVAVAEGIAEQLGASADVRTAVLDDTDQGLGDAVLDDTDVLVWWGHVKQGAVSEESVERVWRRVVAEGMGLIVLHASSDAKIFKRLLGTSCGIGAIRQSDDWEAVWTVAPGHPIARGLPPVFLIPAEEMYCEFFDVPTPDDVVLLSTFRGGEVFRSGCCFTRGNGRIFYFRPGHESWPTYYQPEVRLVLGNAVRWAAERPTPGADLWTIGEVTEAHIEEHLRPEGWFREPGA